MHQYGAPLTTVAAHNGSTITFTKGDGADLVALAPSAGTVADHIAVDTHILTGAAAFVSPDHWHLDSGPDAVDIHHTASDLVLTWANDTVDSLTLQNVSDPTLFGFTLQAASQNLVGTTAAETLAGSNGNDTLDGGAGRARQDRIRE